MNEEEEELLQMMKGLTLRSSKGEETSIEGRENEITIDNALDEAKDSEEVLVSGFSIDLRRRDFLTLRPFCRLNDEIVNFYISLVTAERVGQGVYAFNTFFYSLLRDGGYGRVKTWTRRIDLFAYHRILVPIHEQDHWLLAVINLQEPSIRCYDSQTGHLDSVDGGVIASNLQQYLMQEHLDKHQMPLPSGWCGLDKRKTRTIETEEQFVNADERQVGSASEVPQQTPDSHDCGVFLCQFARFLSLSTTPYPPLFFDCQAHQIPQIRRQMVLQLITKKISL